MKTSNRSKYGLGILLLFSSTFLCSSQHISGDLDSIPHEIYPNVLDYKPNLPSPFTTKDGEEYVVAVNKEKKYAIIQVTLSNDHGICPQLIVDTSDFPQLAQTGLHSEEILRKLQTITDRSLDEITELGRPEGLSYDGFMAHDENIRDILIGDNHLVRQLGLTHPQLAKPLFHVLNMMDADLALNRWNMAKHQWENICCFFYNNCIVLVEASDTKGGQQSIFNDQIQGSFHIRLSRELESDEIDYLKLHYDYLSEDKFNRLKTLLSVINTGEMEPQYIMRYGFYEGHTFWRTDPIAISFIFGLKSLEELNRLFEGKLYEVLTQAY